MEKHQLQERLSELHAELQRVESVGAEEREMLRRLAGDIQSLLGGQDAAPDRPASGVVERMREGVELLEASHPRAAMLMGQVVDALVKIGL
jgi:hypothetical protein